MTDLKVISQELARYKEAKEKAIIHTAEPLKWGDVMVVWDYNNYDYKLLEFAKNKPLETYCEQLIEEIIALRNK